MDVVNLVRCSCGWVAVEKQAGALGTQVKLALPTMVEHWEEGHKVTAAVEIYLTVRAASLDLAAARGIDFVPTQVPYEPREVPRSSRPYATSDDLSRMLFEAMRRRRWRDEW